MPFLDLPKMAHGNAKWQMWQCITWSIFDVEISFGGLKVLEFNQESISEV